MALQTCPKCGKQFYGVSCPDCDLPASTPDIGKIRQQQFIAFILLAALIFFAARLFIENSSFRFPVLVGVFVLVLVGRILASDVKGRPYAVVVGLLLAVLSCGFFYGTFSQSHQWSGGVPFLPASWNDKIGRVLSAFFACLCTGMALCSFYQAVKPRAKK